MSRIIATFDFYTGTWSFDAQDIASTFVELFIGFRENHSTLECCFDDLNFGFRLVESEVTIAENAWPPAGVSYVVSDQEYLANYMLRTRAEKEYRLELWKTCAHGPAAANFVFTTPRPNQPYPSWTWAEDAWHCPVPYPSDGKDHAWDESTLSWVEYNRENI